MTTISVLGIDLGKSSCSVAGLDASGRVALRRRVSRDGIAALLDKLPSARWRWTRAAPRITSGGWPRRTGTR